MAQKFPLTVVVGVMIGVVVRLTAAGGTAVVSAVIAVALPNIFGQCFTVGWTGIEEHTWLLVPALVTS